MHQESEKNFEVLIIDDELDICFLLSSILRKLNFKTSYVTTLASATRVLFEKKPDIIFLDNHLPDGFGVDFIGQIKQDHPLSKIIMISAHDTKEDKMNAFNRGLDRFIGKPFNKDSIIKTLNSLLENIHS